MSALHPVTQTFIAILDNQVARTAAGLKALREDVLMAAPGEQMRSISEIGRHLLSLRRIQLKILAPPLLEQMPNADSMSSVEELRRKLASAAELLKRAIVEYDPADWCRRPSQPRQGVWGDQPTIIRLTRSLNDFTSHLGDIRTIRSILGNPVGRRRWKFMRSME